MVSQTSPFTRNVKWVGYKDESDPGLDQSIARYWPSFFFFWINSLSTYPSLKPTLTLNSQLGQKVYLGEG